MSEFESAVPREEQELKSRTDEVIRNVGALPDEEMGQVAGGDECVEWSVYACYEMQCDTEVDFYCNGPYLNEYPVCKKTSLCSQSYYE